MAKKMSGGNVWGGSENPQGPTGINQAGEGNNSSNKVASPDSLHDMRDQKLQPHVGPRPIEAVRVTPKTPNGRGSHDAGMLGC